MRRNISYRLSYRDGGPKLSASKSASLLSLWQSPPLRTKYRHGMRTIARECASLLSPPSRRLLLMIFARKLQLKCRCRRCGISISSSSVSSRSRSWPWATTRPRCKDVFSRCKRRGRRRRGDYSHCRRIHFHDIHFADIGSADFSSMLLKPCIA